MVNALMSSRLIQLVDRDLRTNAYESSNDDDIGSDALSHGLYRRDATGLRQ